MAGRDDNHLGLSITPLVVPTSRARRLGECAHARTPDRYADLSMAPRMGRRYPMSCEARVVITEFVGSASHCPCLTHEFGFEKRDGRAP